MKTWDEHVRDLADTILTTRDLCGNESVAIRDYLADYGFARHSVNADLITQKARELAEEIWAQARNREAPHV